MPSEQQLAVCAQQGVAPQPPQPGDTCGWSPTATSGAVPINGLRHRPSGATCGWFIWGGEHLGDAADFFHPLHVCHLAERCPEVERFLALPPGWRFLIAPDQVEVWFDPSLLDA